MEINMFLGILISIAFLLAIAAAIFKSIPVAIGAIVLGTLIILSLYRNRGLPLPLDE